MNSIPLPRRSTPKIVSVKHKLPTASTKINHTMVQNANVFRPVIVLFAPSNSDALFIDAPFIFCLFSATIDALFTTNDDFTYLDATRLVLSLLLLFIGRFVKFTICFNSNFFASQSVRKNFFFALTNVAKQSILSQLSKVFLGKWKIQRIYVADALRMWRVEKLIRYKESKYMLITIFDFYLLVIIVKSEDQSKIFIQTRLK